MNESKLFECDCHSRDHILQVWTDDEDLYLTFISRAGDYDVDKWTSTQYHNILERAWLSFGNFFRRKWWRIKKACIILFVGYIDMEDCWIPARMDDNEIFGIKETRRMGEILIKAADDIELAHKEKIKNKK